MTSLARFAITEHFIKRFAGRLEGLGSYKNVLKKGGHGPLGRSPKSAYVFPKLKKQISCMRSGTHHSSNYFVDNLSTILHLMHAHVDEGFQHSFHNCSSCVQKSDDHHSSLQVVFSTSQQNTKHQQRVLLNRP